MTDLINRTDVIEAVNLMEVFLGEDKMKAVVRGINALPSVEPTTEKVWSVAQKVFCSTLTYREAIDYLKEVEKQHKRFLNGKRKNEHGKERI